MKEAKWRYEMELKGKINEQSIYYDCIKKIVIECELDDGVKEVIIYKEVENE